MRALSEVRRFLESLDCRGEPGVVAVSGGADSVALLRALASCDPGPLTVAHVNHQLRGTESDADEAFVRELCSQQRVAVRVTRVDVAALGGNLEAAARRVRYRFFAEVAAEVGAAWTATGHTADDQAETVLHRILRGTGIGGLRGIAGRVASAAAPGSAVATAGFTPSARRWLVRPLLTVTRVEILQYLGSLGQSFREDATNADPRFTRNRIRHELLPLLRTFNPDVGAVLAQLARHAKEAYEIIETAAAERLAQAERPRAGDRIILEVPALGDSPALVRAVLRVLWERENWPMAEMDAAAWDRAVAVATGHLPACDFPGLVSMKRVGRVVQVGR